LFHEIAANVKDGIWVSDKEDRIIFFNTAMENIAGVTADRVIGLKVTSDFGKETTQYFIEYYWRMAKAWCGEWLSAAGNL
jgi:PAS domain S-box-containing protein